MTKIEEIFKKYNSGFSHQKQYPPFFEDIVMMMKEYAEWFAKQCLEKAVESVNIQINTGTSIDYLKSFNSDEYKGLFIECFVNENSILNIKLPEHE